MEKTNGYMEQTADFKKIWLLYLRKIWLIIAVTLVSAMLGALIYKAEALLTYEGDRYRISSDYYLTFHMEGESYREGGIDYYNAFTWDTILRDDPIVDKVLANLPDDYTKEEIHASVTGEMPGDFRILTVHSTHEDPLRAEAIAEAYQIALEQFGEEMDLFTKIERWSRGECALLTAPDLTLNATVLGMLIGFVAAFFIVAFLCLLDDSVYVERDFTKRFAIPFLGILTKDNEETYHQEFLANMEYLLGDDAEYPMVPVGQPVEDFTALRESGGVILMIPWGSKNGKQIEKTMDLLTKQDCKIAGAVVTDADDRFLKMYYLGKKK